MCAVLEGILPGLLPQEARIDYGQWTSLWGYSSEHSGACLKAVPEGACGSRTFWKGGGVGRPFRALSDDRCAGERDVLANLGDVLLE